MNAKDKERVQQQQQPLEQPNHSSVTDNSVDITGAKVRSMLRKKSVATQAINDANSDAEFYVETYNAALERSIISLTIGNIESTQAINNQANEEVKQDFFNMKNQLSEAINLLSNYQIAPSSSKFLLGSTK
jgi:hypothetical protein